MISLFFVITEMGMLLLRLHHLPTLAPIQLTTTSSPHTLLSINHGANRFRVPAISSSSSFSLVSRRLISCRGGQNKMSIHLPLSTARSRHICKMSDSDMIPQLELGRPDDKRKPPDKRVNGIFWIILLNLGIFVADHWFHDMFQAGYIPNLFRGRQTGGCVGSFVPHQCNKSHMLPYFSRALATSSASQSSGQTPRQESENKKKECQIIRSSELQTERCDEISSTKVSLNQFPGLMVHGIVKNSKTRRLLRLNPDTGYFEEQDVAADANHDSLHVPNGHVCRGSAYGWLSLTDDNLDMKLLNPFSRAEIQLPPVKTLPLSEGEEHHLSKWFVSKAVFSANPSIEPRPVVLVIYGENMPKLAFCKPGDKGWTPLEFPEDSFHMDAIYQKGQFYVLGHPGIIVAFDIGSRIDDDDLSVKSVIVATSPKKEVYMRDWYFVVLDGEFFRFELRQACFRDCCKDESMKILEFERRDGDTTDEDYHERKTDGDITDEDYSDEEIDDDGIKESLEKTSCVDMGLPFRTYGIKIRRFDASEKEWVKVESLGDKAVFLGYNTSFALSASDYPAGICIPDSVYFTYGNGGTEHTEKRCYDVGIYNVKDKSVKPLYPMDDDDDEACQFKKPAPRFVILAGVQWLTGLSLI